MELKKDKSFPRGGKKPALFKSSNRNSSLSFFKKSKVKSKKKVKKVSQDEKKKTEKSHTMSLQKEFRVKFVEDLKPSEIQDGMLVLGIVSKISEKVVIVSLPGGLRGAITVANVSQFYRNMIENSSDSSEIPSLTDVFKVGDILPVRVLAASEGHQSLLVTSDPKIINEKLSYNLMEIGLILTGTVKSQEDYGFIIDLGVEHVNSFLSNTKVNENDNLKVGQLVRCCIIECTASGGSCNIKLSVLKKDIQSAVVKKNSTLPLYCFIPGFQFNVTVEETLHEGVEVSYGDANSTKGYIHEDHLLKKFSKPTDVEIGANFTATLLYIKPLVNFLYFKIIPKKEVEWPFKYGQIVSGKVAKVRKTGVFFRIIEDSGKAKCFVPISKLKSSAEFQDKSEILNVFPLNKMVSKIRLANIDLMGRYYMGATDKFSVMEKYYSITDLKCGEIVPCTIISFEKSVARLEIGKRIKAIVSFNDMTDIPLRNPATKFKVGQKVKARVLEIVPEKLFVRVTMKPTLLKEKEILCDIEKYKKNSYYLGTVSKLTNGKIFVKFFNGIFGVLPKHLTTYPDIKNLNDQFSVGQLVKCVVVGIEEKNKLQLSMLKDGVEKKLEIGKKYKVMVTNKTDKGLFLDVFINKNIKCRGYLPSVLLTVHKNLAPALHSTYSEGEKLMAYCLSSDAMTVAPLFGAEEVFQELYEGKSEEELTKLLREDSVIPFLFKNKNRKTNKMYLRSLIPNKTNVMVIVAENDFPENCSLISHQMIFGKVLSVQGKKVRVSTKLSDVWDKDFHSSLEFLNSYLKTLTGLVLRQKYKQNAYNGDILLGNPVKGVIEEVKPNHAIVRTEDSDLGIIEGKFKKGQEINGKIIWIDGPEQIFYVKEINPSEDKSDEGTSVVWENDNLRGKAVFINEEVVVLELKGRGRGELAFLPRKRNLNDMAINECVISVGEELKLWITRKDSNYVLAMDRRVIAMQEKLAWKKTETKLKESVKNLKRKLESEKMERLKKQKHDTEEDDIEIFKVKLSEKGKNGIAELPEVKEEIDVDEIPVNTNPGTPRLEFDDVDIKSEEDVDECEKPKSIGSIRNDERIDLSSSSESEDEEQINAIENSKPFEVGFNWDVLNDRSLLTGILLKKDEASSEDDDDDSKQNKNKRRRLTALEKKEKAKSEEERLRFVEERLMDTEREPESVDDFDRAVLSDPNSSALWLKYMAFHVQGTEIEKARAVARRALKAISFREEQERLNIWIALLNLENMYGTEESLNRTLGEALEVNEPYKIHLHMLNLYGQDNKLQDMEKLGNLILRKYKDLENMWYDVASAYFMVGKIESARNVLQKALTVVEKSQHIPLISRFAQLENKYGSPERAQTLYESILSSFPKRVDIWSCYVDMLVKSNCIDLARQVLERATSQSLRPRKMKTLFKKFIAFEEAHGTPENVEKVREAAVEYVQSVGSNEN